MLRKAMGGSLLNLSKLLVKPSMQKNVLLLARSVVNTNSLSSRPTQTFSITDLSSSAPDISKRIVRKKRYAIAGPIKEKPDKHPTMNAYGIGESIDIIKLQSAPSFQSKYQISYVDPDFPDVLHLSAKKDLSGGDLALKEFFVFTDGVVVFWNMSAEDMESTLAHVKVYTDNQYDAKVVEDEKENMGVAFDGEITETKINSDDEIVFSKNVTENMNEASSILERYAFSQAVAASVKIGIWENHLASFAEPLQKTSKGLARGKVLWKRDDTVKMAGEFAVLRHSLNLKTNLLDTDFYWDRTELQTHYNKMLKYFSVDYRIRTLNGRLTYCEDLTKLIDNLQQHRHASNLEWMIIILIVIEVFFDAWHFYKEPAVNITIVNDSEGKIKAVV
uniref:DUF155 domain-containing protein n=1 Tax=Rhabditophanes sp. KR3021 TaxID=114890 RepID=A0AC35TI52_9BILA